VKREKQQEKNTQVKKAMAKKDMSKEKRVPIPKALRHQQQRRQAMKALVLNRPLQ
jgi:hypothetical protein